MALGYSCPQETDMYRHPWGYSAGWLYSWCREPSYEASEPVGNSVVGGGFVVLDERDVLDLCMSRRRRQRLNRSRYTPWCHRSRWRSNLECSFERWCSWSDPTKWGRKWGRHPTTVDHAYEIVARSINNHNVNIRSGNGLGGSISPTWVFFHVMTVFYAIALKILMHLIDFHARSLKHW